MGNSCLYRDPSPLQLRSYGGVAELPLAEGEIQGVGRVSASAPYAIQGKRSPILPSWDEQLSLMLGRSHLPWLPQAYPLPHSDVLLWPLPWAPHNILLGTVT